jgi:hypothetical protein
MSNSDIERARSNLNISGYTHPDTIAPASTKNKLYKTYDKDSAGLEGYGKPKNDPKYASFSDKTDKKGLDMCPTCKLAAIYECDCEYYCKECKNGHIWHVDITTHNTVIGDPHIDEPSLFD